MGLSIKGVYSKAQGVGGGRERRHFVLVFYLLPQKFITNLISQKPPSFIGQKFHWAAFLSGISRDDPFPCLLGPLGAAYISQL